MPPCSRPLRPANRKPREGPAVFPRIEHALKKLHTFNYWEGAQANLLREILSREEISCLLRNEALGGALGEIPFPECQPELWVLDDEAYPRARLLLDNWLKATPTTPPWICPVCHEALEGQFGACWNCGHPRE